MFEMYSKQNKDNTNFTPLPTELGPAVFRRILPSVLQVAKSSKSASEIQIILEGEQPLIPAKEHAVLVNNTETVITSRSSC